MSNPRQIRHRLRAIRNIQSVAETMATVAISRLQKVNSRLGRLRTASDGAENILRSLVDSFGTLDAPLMQDRPAGTEVLIVITSDRGMCGWYNSRALAAATETAEELLAPGNKVHFCLIGKKGASRMASLVDGPVTDMNEAMERLSDGHVALAGLDETRHPGQADALACALSQAFADGRFRRVQVLNMKLGVGAMMGRSLMPLLPVAPRGAAGAPVQYDAYPDATSVLTALLPRIVRQRLVRALLEAAAAEQTARLMAMRSATTNAQDMTRKLSLIMNRLRQGRITAELAELMGAADAVQGSD